MASGEQAPNAWKVLFLLFLANLLNFFDRAVPAIVIEPIRREWGLSDFQIGLAAAAFTVTYAIAGLPLGRIADTGSRKKVMAFGLIAWSGFTALCGGAWNYGSFIAMRVQTTECSSPAGHTTMAIDSHRPAMAVVPASGCLVSTAM